MKLSRTADVIEAGDGLPPKLLAGALAQAGLLAAVFSMPVCAAVLTEPVKDAAIATPEPLLYIAQASTGYGSLSGGAGTGAPQSGTAQSGTAGGTATVPARPQGSGSPAPKPAPAPDGRNSTR